MLPQDRFHLATSVPILGALGVVPGAGVGESRRAIPRNHTVMFSYKPIGLPRARLAELDQRFSPSPAGIPPNHAG